MIFPLLEAKAFERIPENDLRPTPISPISHSNSEITSIPPCNSMTGVKTIEMDLSFRQLKTDATEFMSLIGGQGNADKCRIRPPQTSDLLYDFPAPVDYYIICKLPIISCAAHVEFHESSLDSLLLENLS